MSLLADLTLVFVAGLITALATGLGALPFFLVDRVGDRWTVVLWGVASGIMLAASVFGLLDEGLAAADGDPTLLVVGAGAGVALVVVADRVLERVGGHAHGARTDGGTACADGDGGTGGRGAATGAGAVRDAGAAGEAPRAGAHVDPRTLVEGDARKLLLVLGVLTVHSFPEGVAIGVSFAELGLAGGVTVLGVAVPLLAAFMTVAISVHNVPEGLAIAIPLEAMGVSRPRMVAAAVFSSLPQPVGAVIAFLFVRWARAFLPFGFGLAAGAMVYLVVAEFVPEALALGADLPGGGRRELLAGALAGAALMAPLLLFG